MSWLDTLEEIRTKDFSEATAEEREHAAREIINICSYACAVVSVVPVPFSDAVLMLPIQVGMVMTVGHIFGRRVEKAEASDLVMELGAVAGAGFLARQGIKALLPVVGALITVPAAYAANWGIGRVAMEYFKNPSVSKAALKGVYEKAKSEGSSLFSREKFDSFRKKNEERIKDVAKEKPASPRERVGVTAAKKKRTSSTKSRTPVKKTIGRKPKRTVASWIEGDLTDRIATSEDVRRAIAGIVQLEISGAGGGQWTVDFVKSTGWISEGLSGTPKLAVRASAETLFGLVDRTLDPQLAVLTGKLKLEPMDLELAAEIAKLFA